MHPLDRKCPICGTPCPAHKETCSEFKTLIDDDLKRIIKEFKDHWRSLSKLTSISLLNNNLDAICPGVRVRIPPDRATYELIWNMYVKDEVEVEVFLAERAINFAKLCKKISAMALQEYEKFTLENSTENKKA